MAHGPHGASGKNVPRPVEGEQNLAREPVQTLPQPMGVKTVLEVALKQFRVTLKRVRQYVRHKPRLLDYSFLSVIKSRSL